jgi:hypothetical protein
MTAPALALVLLALAPRDRDPEEEAALRLARQVLSEELSLRADELQEEGVAEATWPDASLGCPQPGHMYAQVLTRGFRVVLKAGEVRYDVRVAGGRALVCRRLSKPATGALVEDLKGAASMHEKALAALAGRLGVEASAIRVTLIRPVRWPEGRRGCTPAEPGEAPEGPRGFLVTLEHAGRVYLYRDDADGVRPCPDAGAGEPPYSSPTNSR